MSSIKPVLEGDPAFDAVYRHMTAESPAALGKLGSIETELAYYRFKTRAMPHAVPIHQGMLMTLCRNAGMFPPKQDVAERMADELLKSLLFMNALPPWWLKTESLEMFGKFARTADYVDLPSLECFLSVNPRHWWTAALPKGTRVLVISPFADTIYQQTTQLDKVWASRPGLWAEGLEFQVLRFPLSFGVQDTATQQSMLTKWTDSLGLLQDFKAKMDALQYDVALIGVGIHSLPLVAHAKQRGKKAIHLGGATQIYFGIRGGRWDGMKEFQPLFTEFWVRPSEVERPVRYEQVEKGCYW